MLLMTLQTCLLHAFALFSFVFWLHWWIYPPALESYLNEVFVF